MFANLFCIRCSYDTENCSEVILKLEFVAKCSARVGRNPWDTGTTDTEQAQPVLNGAMKRC